MQIVVTWPADAPRAAQLVNQSLVLPAAGSATGEPDGGFYLLVGHVAAPLLASPDDLNRYFGDREGVIETDVRGVFYLSNMRAVELYKQLGALIGAAQEDSAPRSGRSEIFRLGSRSRRPCWFTPAPASSRSQGDRSFRR